ncbi:MAG: ATP-binding protein [Clostridia bacterium]|nr:ATP-binding protein [Clostridia bacterium]
MTETSVTNTQAVQSQNSIFSFDELLNCIGKGQTLWSILTFGVFIIVFFTCIILFKKKVNKISQKQIDDFIRVKKYAPDLYVELNDNMEYLRYFIFSYCWKWRIIRRYNLLFKGYVGAQLKQTYQNKIYYKISYLSKFTTLKKILVETNNVLREFKDDRKIKREELGEFYYIAQNLTYDCINVIDDLLSCCSKIECKNLIIVGSAGNGKTSLLCRATETAMRNNYPCLLINSRDIDGNVIDYVLNKLPLMWKVRKHPRVFLWIVNIILQFSQKHIFVIIDAINENDSSEFLKSIGKVFDFFDRYNRVKIILSCRSEYFDCRYKKLFDASEIHPHIIQLNTADYDSRAITKFFTKYSNYYNVPIQFSSNVKNKINKSLFLMKIFFEVNCGRPHENLEFQNAEIYKQYIEKVASEHTEIDVQRIIKQISSIMIDNQCYDKIDISELYLSDSEKRALFDMLDNNLLINKTIKLGNGLSERTNEFLYFIFDEFRDFCIARELIIRCEDIGDNKFTPYFSVITHMSENHIAPLEGVLKYGYYYFKKNTRFDLSEKILVVYGKDDIQNYNRMTRYEREKTYYFDDFGLTLIYMSGNNLEEYERTYVHDAIKESIRSNVQVFFFLLNNEIANEKPDLHQYLDIIFSVTDDEILSALIVELVKQEKYYHDRPKLIEILYNKIDMCHSRRGIISDNIRMILLLIFSYEFTEWYWTKAGLPIEFQDSLYDFIICKSKCRTLRDKVGNLKQRKNRTSTNGVYSIKGFLKQFD